MSISYKTRWQEVSNENERLRHRLHEMEQAHRKELDTLHSFIESHRSEWADTRPIVDLAGIARHMRVARFTPQQWVQRGLLPPVDFPEIKEPLWFAETVKEKFAEATGRIWYDGPHVGEELSPAA